MENFRFILENYNREKRNRYACPHVGSMKSLPDT